MTDKAENTIEIMPKVKEKTNPQEITLSDELSKLFPEANENIAEQEEKINDLPLNNLEEIFSKIYKVEVPKELKFFVGGLNNEFENRVRSLGISTSSNDFLDFLQSDICADSMTINKLKIHIESGNIYHNNTDTNESICGFFENQEDETKKWIDFEFVLADDYENYFIKYLVNIKDGNDEKYDMLINKNSKFLFYHFNNYLRQINEPTKPVCHSFLLNDETALEILQNKNWQYFIERILEVCQPNNGGGLSQLVNAKEVEIIENSVENLTICKQLYTNFYNQIASNLAEAIRNLPPNELDEIDRDLELNYFFIDFNNEKNEEEIMNAYSYFYHALGRFLGKLDLVIIPKPDIPKFIKTDEIISPNQLYKILRGTDAKGLILVQVLAALNIHLGGDIELSRKTMTECLQNMSMQALNRGDDTSFLILKT